MPDLKFQFRAVVTLAISLSFLAANSVRAENLKSAEITAIVNDVSVINSGKGSRPAKLDETISGQSSVQTGLKSRTELLFSDKTMARLGANSMFSFTDGTRDIDLKQGTMLLQVPKGAGGAKITTAAVTAAITGTTIMIEYFPKGFTKVIVLEGTLRLFLNTRVGESTLLGPGKMVILDPNAKQIPEPVNVDIKRLVKTSKLIQAIDGTDMNMKIVQKEIDTQDKEKKKGDLIGTNLVITGSGTEVVIASQELLNTLQNASSEQQELLGDNNPGSGSGQGSNPPSSPPTKYQPVTTIGSPNPYVINTTTTVVTDPTITTGGSTNQGTLYNSAVQTGSTASVLFGNSSSFDDSSGLNTSYLGQDYSVFRFSNLELDGSPTITTTGGPSDLFLIAEGDITTGSGSFPLAFNGLNSLSLATINGQITLGSSITSLTGPNQLSLYARGTSGNITIDAPVTLGSTSSLGLHAEANINVSSILSATSINTQSLGDTTFGSTSVLKASSLNLVSGGVLTFQASNIDTSALTSFDVNGGTVNFSGNGGFSSANANFTAGTGGFNATSTPALYVASLLSSGDITIANTFTNPAVVNVSGIMAASGNINVNGQITAGSIGAANNITAQKLTSSTNINSTLGNIISNNGDMTATNNITAAGTITSANSIVAGDLLQGTSMTAGGGISGGTIQSTSGDINASGGNLLSTAGSITSAGKINAGGGIDSAAAITANSDITAGAAPSSSPDMVAVTSITSTTGNILHNGNGNIIAGTDITAVGDIGTLYANTKTMAGGTIQAGRLLGGNDPGSASGATTFQAATIIANDVVGQNGANPILLDAPMVTINAQSSNLDASIFSLAAKTITLKGSTAITLTISNPFGTLASPLTSLTTNAQVSITGTNSLYVTTAVLGNNLTLTGAAGNLFADNIDVTGNISVNQIARTSAGLAGGAQVVTASGSIGASATYGLNFQGISGGDGGELTLSAASVTFGTGAAQINGATFVGGDSTGSAKGGKGGELEVKASSGDITLSNGSSIFAHGGSNSGSGNGGDGGKVKLETSTAAASVSLNGAVDGSGGSGIVNGGDGGTLEIKADDSNSTIAVGSSAAINLSGGQGSGGNGGNGGIVNFEATGSGGGISSVPYGNISANGGNGLGGFGGTGGSILWKADGSGGTINHGSYGTLSVNGGSSSAGKGGSAGTIDFQGESVTTQSSTSLQANGGASTAANAEGGNGGTINMTSNTGGVLNLAGNMSATTGTNTGSIAYGGDGGTVNINGGGPVTVSGIIKTSEDGVTDPNYNPFPNTAAKSKNGGKINITSAETDSAKPGITIANSGQLLALLNAAAPGKGGNITFTSAGGKIDISGKLNAGSKGQSGTSGTDGVISIVNNGATGQINIQSTAMMHADVIKTGVFGNNGQINVNGGTFNADSTLKFYATGNSAALNFTGNTTLNSPSTILAGRTITVNNGVQVNVQGSVAQVYTTTANYAASNFGNGSTTGTFTGLGVAAPQPIGSAPAF